MLRVLEKNNLHDAKLKSTIGDSHLVAPIQVKSAFELKKKEPMYLTVF